jgi:hypothetical protein
MFNNSESSPTILTVKKWLWLDYVFVLAFSAFVLLALRYQIRLLDYIEWGDETETIVTAKMIVSGDTLYSNIYNPHGPLTFLPGIIVERIGASGIRGHRIAMMALQLIALLTIYFSPISKGFFTKSIFTICTASVMLLHMPDLFGHTYTYQVLAGLLLIVVFSQYTLPAFSGKTSSRSVIIGNFLIGSLPFLAITYIPVSILIFFASLRKEYIKESFIAILCAGTTNLLVLLYYGSIDGYLAYHIYLNLNILPLYGGPKSIADLILVAYNSVTGDLALFSSFIIFTFSVSRLACLEKGIPWRSLLLSLGVGCLMIRGGGFHVVPYIYSVMAISSILFWERSITSPRAKLILVCFVVICSTKLIPISPQDREKIASRIVPKSTEFSQLVKLVTGENDRIIVYGFRNYEYIVSNRLPASGYFFYLPWQEEYNTNPKLGIKISQCDDIKRNRPKIMLIDKFDKWSAARPTPWGSASYGGCVEKIILDDYVEVPGKPYYLRKDIVNDTLRVTLNLAGFVSDSFYLTDENWVHGVARKHAGFYIPNTVAFRNSFMPGREVLLADVTVRKITRVERSGIYLNVSVEGEHLDPIVVGLPKFFKIIDFEEAVKWYRLSAEQGDANAQINLGEAYAKGKGVPKDLVLAYKWSNMASAQGNENASLLLADLEKAMTRSQIEEAQRLSSEWFAKRQK